MLPEYVWELTDTQIRQILTGLLRNDPLPRLLEAAVTLIMAEHSSTDSAAVEASVVITEALDHVCQQRPRGQWGAHWQEGSGA